MKLRDLKPDDDVLTNGDAWFAIFLGAAWGFLLVWLVMIYALTHGWPLCVVTGDHQTCIATVVKDNVIR